MPVAHNPAVPRATSHALAGLLSTVLSDSMQTEPAAARFARGLRDLIGAHDVLIRRGPIPAVDDTESIYFHVQGNGSSRTVLQVMFEKDSVPSAEEFKLMKASASLAAALFELERVPANESRQAPTWTVDVA
jgi:hypothetical protein